MQTDELFRIARQAIAQAGGAKAVSTRLQLSKAAPYLWRKVPLKYLPFFMDATGWAAWVLRPDVYQPPVVDSVEQEAA